MSILYSAYDQPVEIAPGRGDLRYSSYAGGIRPDPGARQLIGGRSVSYANLFATQPWIGAAVMRMLTWAVRVPLKAYRRTTIDSREELEPTDHPLARIIRRPWLGQEAGPSNQNRLVQHLLGPLLVHGNAIAELETTGGDEWLCPRDWRYMTAIGTATSNQVQGWRLQQGSEERDIPLARSLHLSWWSPLGPLGVSPLEQLGVTVSIEDAAQRYQQSLFAHGARPPSAITASPEFLSMDRVDRQKLIDQLRDDVEEIYSGPDRAGKPAVLPPGLDWKSIGHSAVEAALIDQRKVARDEVCAVYQIPPPMLGILDNATYSNIDVQREMAYTMALAPPLVMIEQAMTAIIARDFYGEDDVYVEFDFGHVLRGDRLKEINAFRLGIGSAIYTPNESRRALNMPAYDDPAADELYLPTNNLSPLGEKEEPAPAPPPPPGPDTGDETTPSD